jgi:N-acyl-D-aspartate/D-glutamate deacylase
VLREGPRADITIVDPAQVADRATHDDPHRYPVGIPTVSVSGVVVIDAGDPTGALPVPVLRRTAAGGR